jgi:hypothetical protein
MACQLSWFNHKEKTVQKKPPPSQKLGFFRNTLSGQASFYGGDPNRVYLRDAFSDYYIAGISEDSEHKSEAIKYYSIFLDHFKNADPGLVEKEDAGKRLQRLKNPS